MSRRKTMQNVLRKRREKLRQEQMKTAPPVPKKKRGRGRPRKYVPPPPPSMSESLSSPPSQVPIQQRKSAPKKRGRPRKYPVVSIEPARQAVQRRQTSVKKKPIKKQIRKKAPPKPIIVLKSTPKPTTQQIITLTGRKSKKGTTKGTTRGGTRGGTRGNTTPSSPKKRGRKSKKTSPLNKPITTLKPRRKVIKVPRKQPSTITPSLTTPSPSPSSITPSTLSLISPSPSPPPALIKKRRRKQQPLTPSTKTPSSKTPTITPTTSTPSALSISPSPPSQLMKKRRKRIEKTKYKVASTPLTISTATPVLPYNKAAYKQISSSTVSVPSAKKSTKEIFPITKAQSRSLMIHNIKLETELKLLLKEVVKYQNKLLKIRQKILNKNYKTDKLNQQLNQCQQEIQNKEHNENIRVQQFKLKLQQNDALIQQYNMQIERYKQQIDTHQQCINSLENLQEQYNQVITEHDNINDEISTLHNQINEYELKMKQMQVNTDPSVRAEIIKCQEKINQTMKQIESDTEIANKKYNDLLQENNALQAQLPGTLQRAAKYIPKLWSGLKWATQSGWVMMGGSKITKYMYQKLYGTNNVFQKILQFKPAQAIDANTTPPSMNELLSNNKNLRVLFEFFYEIPGYYVRHVWNGSNLISFKISNKRQNNDLDEIIQERAVIEALKAKNYILQTNRGINAILYERQGKNRTIRYFIRPTGKPSSVEAFVLDKPAWPDVAP